MVLPELFTCAYSALESVYNYAEDAEDAEYGESAWFFTGLARELGIYIAYGFPEGVAGSPIGELGIGQQRGSGRLVWSKKQDDPFRKSGQKPRNL